MKLPKSCKIELVASNDAGRKRLAEPCLVDGHLVASNGQAMVVIPVECSPEDTNGYITRQALQAARKVSRIYGDCDIRANGALTLADGTQFPRPTEFKYPEYKNAIPSDTETYPLTIGLNVRTLWEMAQAMGCEHVSISIKDAISPFMVRPAGHPLAAPKAMGVLMPYKIT